MDDLIVGKGQHEVLAVGVHHREGHLIVMPLAMHCLALDVAEGVVHPAHVPLQAEAESPEIGGTRDPGPCRGLLGDRDDAGDALVDRGVHLLEECHGVEVLAASVDVGSPLAGFTRVVEVEHRGHRVDAESVDMEFLAPVDRIGHEEIAHLCPAEVEDVGAPIGMLSALGIGVLVERCAVEARQRPVVLGEVGRHPVDDHTDPRLVEAVDEVAQVVRTAKARRGSEVGRDLVAPRASEGMGSDGEELHVGEALVDDVRRELLGELAIVQAGTPRAEVHLVDRHGLTQRVRARTSRHPRRVLPVVVGGGDHGSGGRGHLGGEGEGVGLLAPDAIGSENRELVDGAIADIGDEDFPSPRGAQAAHGVGEAVPVIEASGHAHSAGVGGPHRERHASDFALRRGVGVHVCAHDAPQLLVAPLGDEVHVQLAEGREESIGVVCRDDAPAVGHVEPVVRHLLDGEEPGPDASVFVAQRHAGAVIEHDDHRLGHRAQDADRDTVLADMGSEDGVRIAVAAINNGVQLRPVDLDRLGELLVLRLGPVLGHGARSTSAMWATVTAGSRRT